MKNQLLLLWVLLLLISTYSFSQTPPLSNSAIKGNIKSKSEEIPYANILILKSKIGVAANEKGYFIIKNAPLGKLKIRASAVGYHPQIKTIETKKNTSIQLNFTLDPSVITTEQVVVSASRIEQNRTDAPVIVNTISPKLLQSTNAVNLAEGLNFSPGLRIETNCLNCGFNQLRLNGLKGPYTQFLINSRPIFSALNGVYGLEQIPANMIDRIEVVRGGGSALFGANAIGGTVNIITKDPINNSFTLINNTSLVNGKTFDESINFSISQVTDNYRTGIFAYGLYRNRQAYDHNGDNLYELTKIRNRSFGLRSYYRTSDYSKLILDFGTIYELRRGGNKEDHSPHIADVAEQLIHNITNGGLSWEAFSKDNQRKISIYLSGSNTKRKSYYGAKQDQSAYGRTEDYSIVGGIQWSQKINHKKFFHSHSTILTGIENTYNQLKDTKLGYQIPDFTIDSIINYPNTTVTHQGVNAFGIFLQEEIDFHIFTILAGIRYDRADIINLKKAKKPVRSFNSFNPRTNILFKINKAIQIRGSFASGFRPPQVFNEDLHLNISGGQKIRSILSNNLEPETSNSFTASFEWTTNKSKFGTQLTLESFYTILNNPFHNELETLGENDLVYVKKNATSGAFVKGINVEFKSQLLTF
ncbi:MAG: TonB-dependent receptor domain-containing protein [Bacteroidales bacterium]